MIHLPLWIYLAVLASMALTFFVLGLMLAPTIYVWVARKKAERARR